MWELVHKEDWALKKWCSQTAVLEKTLKSPSDCKQIKPVNPKANQSWIFTGKTDAKAEALILRPPDWKKPWCWERSKAGGEGGNRGWDGSMASLIQWTWVWESSRRWWRTGKPGVLQSMGSQRVGHTEWQNNNNNKAQEEMDTCLWSDKTMCFGVLRSRVKLGILYYFWLLPVLPVSGSIHYQLPAVIFGPAD